MHPNKREKKKKHTYVWKCSFCGLWSVPYRTCNCPQCGAGRDITCTVTRVEVRCGRLYNKDLHLSNHRRSSLRHKRRRRTVEKKVLPVQFIDGEKREIMACYDTGTYGNHISLALATAMGYELDHSFQDSFKLPNGNHLRSIGRITAKIRFLHKTYTHDETDVISCHFNVYDRLAIPLLLGMTFLHGTETLSKHRYRLKTIADYNLCLHRICSIGAATNRISCMINGRLVNSQADTGSDIALVDSQYVKTHGLELLPGCEKLMFADGSVGYTQGCVDVILTLPTAYDKGRTPWQKVRFHVLENCSFDFIFDETLVEDYGIFQETCKSLEICTGVDADVIAPIIHLGPVENVFAKASDKIKAMLKPQRPATVGESAKAEQNAQKEKNRRLLAEIARLDQEEHRQRIWASKQNFTERSARAEQQRQNLWEEKRYDLEREYLGLVNKWPGNQDGESRPALPPAPSSPPLDRDLYAPGPSRTSTVALTEAALCDFEALQIA